MEENKRPKSLVNKITASLHQPDKIWKYSSPFEINLALKSPP